MRAIFTILPRCAILGPLVALVALVALAAGATAAAAPSNSDLQVVQHWRVGGAGGWDYLTLDAAGKRLFVSRATRVDVISTDSGKVIGSIPNTQGVHGIALAEDSKRGYTSNGKADSVTMFDSESLAVIREVKIAAHNPDAILYEPVGKHVFTFNGKSKDVTVLDASSLEVVATLAVPDKPEFAVDDGNGHIYVNIESEAGQMTVIDSRKLSVLRTFPLPGCARPSGLAIDRAHHRLFSVCDGKTMAITDVGQRQASGSSADRRGSGCGCVRFQARAGFQLQRRRNPDRGSPGVGGSLLGAGHGADPARRAHHGARRGVGQGLCRHGRLWGAARGDRGATPPAPCSRPRYVHGAGGRRALSGSETRMAVPGERRSI